VKADVTAIPLVWQVAANTGSLPERWATGPRGQDEDEVLGGVSGSGGSLFCRRTWEPACPGAAWVPRPGWALVNLTHSAC